MICLDNALGLFVDFAHFVIMQIEYFTSPKGVQLKLNRSAYYCDCLCIIFASVLVGNLGPLLFFARGTVQTIISFNTYGLSGSDRHKDTLSCTCASESLMAHKFLVNTRLTLWN